MSPSFRPTVQQQKKRRQLFGQRMMTTIISDGSLEPGIEDHG